MHNTKSKKGRVIVSLLLTIVMVFSVITIGATTTTAETSTGIGLSAHCLKAYNEGWSYVWGGMSPGAVDCSGMIQLYNGVGGVRTDMVSSSPEWGYVSNGIPRIHGLGLHKPGHVGVYVGSGLAIDARGTNWGVCFNSVDAVNWVEWFKVYGVSYPTQGWVRFNGDSFYYENGQYIINTSRTLDGVSYYFDSTGASDKQPPESSYKVTDYSGSSSSSGSSLGSSSSYLKIGSQGSKVEEIQKKLKKLGYFDDDVTGYYGTYTAACVKEFQTDAHIEVDGVVGPEFLSVINGDNPPKKNASNNKPNNNNSADNPADNTYEEDNNTSEDATEEVTEAPTEEPTEAPTEEPTEEVTEATTEEATEAATEESTEKPTEAPTEAPTSDGTLRYGDSGDEITKLQNRLAELGYYTTDITSVFDDNTLEALHAYFSASELMQNNEITKEQLAVLYSSSAVQSPSTYVVSVDNQSSDDVKAIQKNLVTLGYLNEASGTYDADTESAVKVAQSNFDMKVTGTADEEFVDALELETARQNSQTVENATVKNKTEDNALAPLSTGGVKSITNASAEENSLVLVWVAAAMIILALTATIVYVKHRKSRKAYRR